ncbi:hypothetical protein AN639_07225 [Candidatus Epulonipiscium fishelsonii]|uniref:Uncharacterized protein n=1 Tax=Candidatus Epulonipiscium fishelsonii TaxID=77094 RepID=A0ACC8XA85_9FIRM|nr:hypothetical protein AN639_07225 [Epulopiscium sp. SCG-B05WGA-EpuloA1]ONI39041.1 hypothetical protein AN396_09205 [Epulopiscium sp. SCG-B11WGA-EpuloA1]
MNSKDIIVSGLKDVRLIDNKVDESPLKYNEALIENEVSLISPGTELSRVYGIKQGVEYPVYTGYICIGKILEKGEGLEDIKVGDRVLFNGNHKQYQRFTHGGKNLELIVKVDDELSSFDASLTYISLIAINGVLATDIKLGDTVAVIGLGIIGIITSLLYQLAGARVIAVDPVKSRTDLATNLGIKEIVNCEPEKIVEEVLRLTSDRGADITVDTAGNSGAIITAINCAGLNGQVLLTGSPRSSHIGDINPVLNRVHMKMLKIIGGFNGLFPYYETEGSRLCVERNLKYIMKCLKNKDIDASKIISHVMSPTECQQAYKGLMEEKDIYQCVAFDWKKLNK